MSVWNEAYTLLSEDSRGNIKRLLGMHPDWAQIFYDLYGQHAFTIAKIMKMTTSNSPTGRPWSAQPPAEYQASWDKTVSTAQLVQDDIEQIVRHHLDFGAGVSGLIDLMKRSPELERALNSLPNSAGAELLDKTIRQAKEKLGSTKPVNPQDVVLRLGDGWFWLNLRTSKCDDESQLMGHCGTDERGTLYSLRDSKNRPHVTLTYNEKRQEVHQIRGKQNAAPAEKYWPAIKTFFDSTGAKLVDRASRRSDLGRFIGQADPQLASAAKNAVARVGDRVWIRDPEVPDGYVLVQDDEVDAFLELNQDDDMGHAGYDYAWIQDGELDYMATDVAVVEPLLQALRQNDPDLRLRQEPPGMGVPHESLALEHARMMGPVAYAEALASFEGVHDGLRLEYLSDIAGNRKEAIQTLKDVIGANWDLLVQRGIDPEGMKYLGTGRNGSAWQLADRRVLKVTTDDAEAHVASFLKGKQFKHIFRIYDVWAFPGKFNGHHIYGLITEENLVKPSRADREEFDQMCTQIEGSYGEEVAHGYKQAAYDLWSGDLRTALQGFMASDIHPNIKRQVLQSVKKFDLAGMCADVKRLGVQADLHSGNMMKRTDGTFVIIDIGTGGNDESDTPPFLEELDLEGLLREVGILGAPQAGSGSQMRGMGSTAWSGGKLVLADPKDHVPVDDEDEEAAYLDQDLKGLGPNGAGSPY